MKKLILLALATATIRADDVALIELRSRTA